MPGLPLEEAEDIFESSLHLENEHYEVGYDDGFKDGMQAGEEEGIEVGLKSGFQLGEEIGFYRGCTDVWMAALDSGYNGFTARSQRNILQFHEQLQSYPLLNPQDERVQDMLEEIRVKFQAILSMLSIHLDYKGSYRSIPVENNSF